ncbi:MAG TPA: RNA 2',3'-cyclic phosphodiesterase [Bryobacteraceae bacterium]|jgi:2'-5' RNA ligase|nr:RNA 2',3'-cyclic phosphodiesterase [Bryobacteraceae bacterium]
MRLFTAIDLPDELLLRVERLIAALRPEAFVKWSPIDNIHITTKFVGEWPEARLAELNQALISIQPRRSFEVELKGFGWFPDQGPPRVLWSGVYGGDALTDLVRDTEESAAALGVKREIHPYMPHLTLARINNRVPLDGLRQKLAGMRPAVIGSFPVSRFHLYQSQPGSNASLYRKLYEYNFEKAATANIL